MNKARFITVLSIVCVVAIAAAVMIPIAKAGACGMMPMGHKSKDEIKDVKEGHSAHLEMISTSIEKAMKAIESEDKETAMAELNNAQQMLAVLKKGFSGQEKSGYVNTKCPMMGGEIDPEKVTSDLTRQFQGQTVAFCCGGCPGMWDKLSDTEKEAKLSKVKTEHLSHSHSE